MDRLKSRKLWVTVIGAAILAFAQGLGFTEGAATEIADLIKFYLIGQAGVDAIAGSRP